MTEGYRPNIKGVIFDKDGTLYNYSQVWGPVVKDYVDTILKTFSVRNEKKARQEIFEIIGVDNRGNHYPDGLLFNHDKIARIFFRILNFCIRNTINPFKLWTILKPMLNGQSTKLIFKLRSMDFTYLTDLFRELSEKSIIIGLVTNDITSNTKAFLDISKTDQYVRFLRTKESNCKRKPHTESIKQFEALYGLKSEEICIVGDSIVDMEYARRGRVGYTVAVLTGYGLREKLEEYADVVYDRIEDLASDRVLFPKRT